MAVCSRSATRSPPWPRPKVQQPYREHGLTTTSAELPCALINSHPPTPFPPSRPHVVAFCPPPSPPFPSNPCSPGCGRPWTGQWTGPREKAKLQTARHGARSELWPSVFFVVPLTSSFPLWVTVGGHWGLPSCRDYVKLGAFPSCPTYTITLSPSTPPLLPFSKLFPGISPQPNTDTDVFAQAHVRTSSLLGPARCLEHHHTHHPRHLASCPTTQLVSPDTIAQLYPAPAPNLTVNSPDRRPAGPLRYTAVPY
ncbi:hypothetical protein QBC39DRAFT_40944 [Podospora conica]|nr:hypothetical protein QBC39DRAFT_40944 [Schizothecium conicum]